LFNFYFGGCAVTDSGECEWLSLAAGMRGVDLAARGSLRSRVFSRTYSALLRHVVKQWPPLLEGRRCNQRWPHR